LLFLKLIDPAGTKEILIKPSYLSSLGSELRCKKCSSPVATSSFFLAHIPPDEQQDNFSTRNGMAVASSISTKCSNYFVEPVSWMRNELSKGTLEGKLACAKCQAKLGAYHWQGQKCSCGVWVTPAFMIQRARVDEVFRTKTMGSM
jgi:dual specificity phosphatase 12